MALVGPPGCGKTHLARAWASKVGATTPHGAKLAAVARAVLVEDADLSVDEDSLFHLINRTDAGATLLLTGRNEPATWRTGLADLRSRLNALTVARIEAPDDVVLLGVMKKLFGERNIRPRKDVYTYILRRIERSVPAVQDLVKEIDELAAAEKCEVTRTLVGRILRRAGGTLEDGR
jgi:chromosomal replication initiation ATPase DnaA